MTRKELMEQRSAVLEKIAGANTNDELDACAVELRKLDTLLANTPEETRSGQSERTAAVTAETPEIVSAGVTETRGKTSDNMEYRKAFMNYVTKGTAIPQELRDSDAYTVTTDIGYGVGIPQYLVNQIIEKMDNVGMILPLVTHTSFKGGVTVPTSAANITATWVAERGTSLKQKKTLGSITFACNKLRCAIAMSLEVSVMSIEAFERSFVQNVVTAMVTAREAAIISGDGDGEPKGILAETAPSGQALTASALSYKLLCDIEAAIPAQYESTAVHCMTKKTFMAYMAMTDENGQPIARVNYGIGGKPERTLLGRDVVLADLYMPSFATASEDDVFQFVFDFKDYWENVIYDMGIVEYYDNETEDKIKKAVMLVDGKVVNKESLVTVAKAAEEGGGL